MFDLRSGIATLGRAIRHPKKTFTGLSSNGKLVVFLSTILLLTGIISIITVVSSQDEVREDTAINNFETQVSTLTPLQVKITLIDGNVSYKSSSGTGEWEKASNDTEITTNDEVKTEGAGSRAILTFVNGSESRLDGDSHVKIDASTEEKIETFVQNGRTYNRVTSDSIPYSVETSDAHYEALGTVFVVESSGDRQSIDVIESSIIETTTNNTIDQGNRYIVKSMINPSDNKKVERIEINDYKNDPFIEWNLSIDEANEEYKKKLGFLQDTEAPTIEIISPKQDEVILTASSSDTGSVQIKGKAPSATKITVTAKSISGSPTVEATIESDGSFTAPAIDSPLGLSVFELEARDRAGNISTASLRVTIQQKSAPVEEEESSLLLLKSVENKNDSIYYTWYMSKDIDESQVRVLYSKTNNPTLSKNEGVKTPNKGGDSPATVTASFDSGGLDKDTYYIRMCELNEAQTECVKLSNSLSVEVK